VYMALTLPLGTICGRRLGAPMKRWLTEERPPTPSELHRTLAFPWMGYQVMGSFWLPAALLFGAINATYSIGIGVQVACVTVLGGLTTCLLVVLWVARTMREVIALALESGVPSRPIGPGVRANVLVAWGLATGIPLVLMTFVAVAALVGADVSPRRLAVTAIFLATIGLAAGFFAVGTAGRLVAEPIGRVRAALSHVEGGDLDTAVQIPDGTEVGLLAAGFNSMVAGLREREQLRDLFGRHVGEGVVRRALEHGVELGGERRWCAVLFVDLLGSTSLAMSRPPEEVVALLNDFFGAIVAVSKEHGGLVNKFEGDAALCIFGAPVEHPDAATSALSAARQLRLRVAELLPDVRSGVGVSAGTVVAGNVGAQERYEYTVIGDAVNEAARLSDLAKRTPEGLLASVSVVEAADPAEAARWQAAEEVVLRGRGAPTRTARPLDVSHGV